MKTLALLSLCLAVAVGKPVFPQEVEQNPVLTAENQSPLQGDVLPPQGHVVVDDPLPQVRSSSKEQQEELAPVPVDMEQMVELEIKVKPKVGVVREVGVKKEPEVKAEPEVKVEQEFKEVKAEPEVKVEQELKEVKAEPEVKVEQELKEVKAEPEVKVEQELKEVKAEPEVKVEQELKEVKAEPEVKVEQELKEVKAEPEVKVEQELKEVQAEPEVKVEQELKEVQAEPEVKVEPEFEMELELEDQPDFKVDSEVKVEPEFEMELELEDQPDFKVDSEVKAEPEFEMELELEDQPDFKVDSEVKVEPEFEMELELEDQPDFKVDSEVKVEPDALQEPEPEVEPVFNEVEDEFQVQMNLEPEPETGREFEERHIDMEGKYAMIDEPIMELEPLDDDRLYRDEPSDTQLSEAEKSMMATFQNQDPVNQPLPEEEEEALMRGRDYVVDEEPIMELEPLDDGKLFRDELSETELAEVEKSMMATFQNQDPVNQPLPEEEEEALMRGRDYVVDEEPIMELEPLDDDKLFGDELSDTQLSEVEKSLRASFQNQDPVNQPLPGQEDEYVLGEEPIMELEPEMEQEQVVPDAAAMEEEGPPMTIMEQHMQHLEEHFPDENARLRMEPMMMEEPGREFVGEAEVELSPVAGVPPFEEPAMEDSPVFNGGVQTDVERK